MRYVYVMKNTRYPCRYKIGISNNVSFRKQSISKTLKGEMSVIFSAKFFFAEQVETMMHQIYQPLHAKMKGSGKTEWFWFIVPFSPILILCIIWILQRIIPFLLVYFLLITFNAKKTINKNDTATTDNLKIKRVAAKRFKSPALDTTYKYRNRTSFQYK